MPPTIAIAKTAAPKINCADFMVAPYVSCWRVGFHANAHPPRRQGILTFVIRPDALTNPSSADLADPGNPRRLAPILGFPAMSVPAGFTADGHPWGLSLWGTVRGTAAVQSWLCLRPSHAQPKATRGDSAVARRAVGARTA